VGRVAGDGAHDSPRHWERVDLASGPAGEAVVRPPGAPEPSFRMSLVRREKQTSSLIMVERAEKPSGKQGFWLMVLHEVTAQLAVLALVIPVLPFKLPCRHLSTLKQSCFNS